MPNLHPLNAVKNRCFEMRAYHQWQLIEREVKARRRRAIQLRGDRMENGLYNVEQELVIPDSGYKGESPLASILVTITPDETYSSPTWRTWRAEAHLLTTEEEKPMADTSQPTIGSMVCADSEMTLAEAKGRADLWVRDSYWWVPESVDFPLPEGTQAAAVIKYLVRRPPARL